jgi:hypothetical protein
MEDTDVEATSVPRETRSPRFLRPKASSSVDGVWSESSSDTPGELRHVDPFGVV